MATSISVLLIGVCVVVGATAWRSAHRRHRDRMYADLASQRGDIVSQYPVAIADPNRAPVLAANFSHDRMVAVSEFVTPEYLQQLRSAAAARLDLVERSYLPGHKKGGTISYESISRHLPGCLAFYHSPEVQQFVSDIVGERVHPTPDQDQSSLSLLCYTEAGDHINWHFDHNFYRGRHFTVLLSLTNAGPHEALSQSRFQRKNAAGEVLSYDTPPNTLVVFEGARVLHRATPTGPGDLRLMLSMTYSADPRISRVKEGIRRVKDTAFYGLRALWD